MEREGLFHRYFACFDPPFTDDKNGRVKAGLLLQVSLSSELYKTQL